MPASNRLLMPVRVHPFSFLLPPQTTNQFKKLYMTSRTLQILKNKPLFFLKIVERWKKNDEEFDTLIWRNYSSKLKHQISQQTLMMRLDFLFFLFYFLLPIFAPFSTFHIDSFKTIIKPIGPKVTFQGKIIYLFTSTSYI